MKRNLTAIIKEGWTELPLTQGVFALVDNEDAEKLSRHKWYAVKRKNGKFHAVRRDRNITIFMHNDIMNFITAQNTKTVIDHKDGDSLNNRKFNLRKVSRRINALNSDYSRNAKTLINRSRNGFRVVLRIEGIIKRFGPFATEEEALAVVKAYRDAS